MRRLSYFALALAFVLFGSTAAQAGKGGDKPKKSPEARFNKADKNGDGKLSLDEFIGKKTDQKKERATRQFAKLDKDGDKQLTLDELKARKKKGE